MKLHVHQNDSWEIVSGISGALKRGSEHSLTSPRTLNSINNAFDAALRSVNYNGLDFSAAEAAEQQMEEIIKAFRGFSCLIQGGYKERIADQLSSATGSGGAITIPSCYKEIRNRIVARVRAIARVAPPSGSFIKYDQSDFFPKLPDQSGALNKINPALGDGKCWGIACNWVSRWIVKGKTGYAKASTPWVVFMPSDFQKRMRKKAPVLFSLHDCQHSIKTGDVFVGEILHEKILNHKSAGGATLQQSEYLYQQNVVYHGAKKVPDGAVNILAKKALDYSAVHARSRSSFDFNEIYARISSEAAAFSSLDSVFNYMNSTDILHRGRSGYLICFHLTKSTKYYTAVDEEAGHAIAAFRENTKPDEWYFMDPNLGEWKGSFFHIKRIIERTFAFYSAQYAISHVNVQHIA